MATRRIFHSQNNHIRLEEALESIISDENDDVEYDMVLVLPNPDILSDDEEGDEDDL